MIISDEYEVIMNSIADNKVPLKWSFAYQSIKPLANWIRDLNERYNFFKKWAFVTMPAVFWISAFTYPTGFTTAVKQKFSRRGGQNPIPIDKLDFDFSNIYQNEAALIDQPKDGGAFIKGLFLEGAKWDIERNCLEDADSMVLNFAMPIIHFKPVSKKPKAQNIYNCPCYYYPI